MPDKELDDSHLPALFQSSDKASLSAQSNYFLALKAYLYLLIIAALISFGFSGDSLGALISAALFLITLGILIWLNVRKPEDAWYNGRAVAESVKTRSWRWVMKADPYDREGSEEEIQKQFLSDLKSILDQNKGLSEHFDWKHNSSDAISDRMKEIRSLPLEDRLEIYKKDRVNDQARWYAKKAGFNKRKAKRWFVTSIILHSLAVLMLLYRIKEPSVSLPIEVVATAASAVLTWLQSKKYNELNSSYSLAAHEIVLIKGEADAVNSEGALSNFVVNSESAFSREHTQWSARKNS